MGVIELPPYVPGFEEMDSTPEGALALASDLRIVCAAVKDVQGWAAAGGVAVGEGDAADAHDRATTRFATRLDASEAALERAATAADRFEARLGCLLVRRAPIEAERLAVNRDGEALRAEIAGVLDDERLAGLRRRAARLVARARAVLADVADWVRDYDTAEADFIAALQHVDTVAEGERAARTPGRPDVATLTKQFEALRGGPAALAAWWAGLSRAQREAMTMEHPRAVGNANGLPSRDRDEANRTALGRDLDHLGEREEDGRLTSAEKRALANARDVDDAMRKFRQRVDPATGRELAMLLVYRPDVHSGDGAVAISFGDPDRADHVSVNVPGLTSETSSTLGNLEKTYALHEAVAHDANGTVASIYWLDYDAPSGNPLNPLDPGDVVDFGGVAFTEKAEAGGERFSDFVDGLHASDRGGPAHVTVIGHSYGSTMVGHALHDGMRVDDAVLIGSPGQPDPTAAQLTGAHVWVGSKDDDPVSLLGDGDRGGLGVLGHDPADVAFGGTRFETGDGSLRVQSLLDNHTSYFEGTSLANIAHIVSDSDGAVTEQPHRGEEGGDYRTLDELLVDAASSSLREGVDHAIDAAGDAGGWLWEHTGVGGMLVR